MYARAASQRITPRERRTILIGGIVSAVALVVAFGVVPFARTWGEREDAIATARDRLHRMRSLAAHEAQLREAVRDREAKLGAAGQRLLAGRTSAVAASALQTLIQGYADQSRVTVTRLDVAGAPDTTAGPMPMIPATFSAIADIHGVSELLGLLQTGPRTLEVTEVSVVSNSALKGGLLQMSLVIRAPFMAME